MGKTSINGPFSMAMLNNQRVNIERFTPRSALKQGTTGHARDGLQLFSQVLSGHHGIGLNGVKTYEKYGKIW